MCGKSEFWNLIETNFFFERKAVWRRKRTEEMMKRKEEVYC